MAEGAELNKIDASQKVWVGNLPAEATAEDVEAHFRQLGEPIAVQLMKAGIACVAYATSEEAETAQSAYDGSEIGGNKIKTDAWSAKMPARQNKAGGKNGGKNMNMVGGKGQKGGGGCQKGGGGCQKGGGKGKGPGMHMGGGMGQPAGFGAWAMPSAAPMMMGKGVVPPAWGLQGVPSRGWPAPAAAAAPPKWMAEKAAAGPTEVHWLTVPDSSALVAQGLPVEGPAIVYQKGDDVFSCATLALSEVAGDIAAEVQIVHDADWEQFPEIGEVIKDATGEEQCFAVAICASKGTWAIGVGNGWKTRESSAKVSLALALAAQDMAVLGQVSRNYPDFGKLARQQGLQPAAVPAAPAAGRFGGRGAVESAPAAGPPPVRTLTLDGESKITEAGLPAEGPAIEHEGKQMKEYFSNAHSILQEMVEDISADVTFEDDADWKNMPEVGEALKAAGGAENGLCVASCASVGVWGVGVGSGWKSRESASKLALALAIAQSTDRLDEFAKNYSEFGEMCAAAGLVEPPAKRRRGGKGGKW